MFKEPRILGHLDLDEEYPTPIVESGTFMKPIHTLEVEYALRVSQAKKNGSLLEGALYNNNERPGQIPWI